MVFKGTRALEEWSRRVCSGYPGVNINNMTTAFKDGLAFCAIIHRFRPDLLDYNSLSSVNVKENCALAFSLADSYLGIEPLLDPEDMAECVTPDRKSILLYLSQIYQVLGNQSPEPSQRTINNTSNSAKHLENVTSARIKSRKNSTDSGIDTNLSISVDSVSSVSSSGVSSESDLSPQLRTAEPLNKSRTIVKQAETTKIVKSENIFEKSFDTNSEITTTKNDISPASTTSIPPKPVRTFAHGKFKYNNNNINVASSENFESSTNQHQHSLPINKVNTTDHKIEGEEVEERKDSNNSSKSISLQQQQHSDLVTSHNNNNNYTTTLGHNNALDDTNQNNEENCGEVCTENKHKTLFVLDLAKNEKCTSKSRKKEEHSVSLSKNTGSKWAELCLGKEESSSSITGSKVSASNGLQGILKKAGTSHNKSDRSSTGSVLLREPSTRLRPGEVQVTSIKKEGVGGETATVKSSPSFHNALNVFTNLEKGNVLPALSSEKAQVTSAKPLAAPRKLSDIINENIDEAISDMDASASSNDDDEIKSAPVMVTSSTCSTQTDFPPMMKPASDTNKIAAKNTATSTGYEKTRKRIHNRERTQTISDLRSNNSVMIRAAVQAAEVKRQQQPGGVIKDPLVKTRSQGSLEINNKLANDHLQQSRSSQQQQQRPGADLRVRSTEVLDWVHSRQPLSQAGSDQLLRYGTLGGSRQRDLYHQQHELVRPSGVFKSPYTHLATNSLVSEVSAAPSSSATKLTALPGSSLVVAPIFPQASVISRPLSLHSHATESMYASYTSLHNTSASAKQDSGRHGSLLQGGPRPGHNGSFIGKVSGGNPETCNVTDFVRTFDTKLYVKAAPNHSDAVQSVVQQQPQPANSIITSQPQSSTGTLLSFSIPQSSNNNYHPLSYHHRTTPPTAVGGKLMWKTPPQQQSVATSPTVPTAPQLLPPLKLVERNMSSPVISVKGLHFGSRSIQHEYEHSTLV